MRRAVPLALLALGACREAKPPEPAPMFANAAITLPAESVVLPATPAGELIANACTACHSAEMIRQQPALDAKKWAATVKKMREAYHAGIAPADDAALVSALVTLQGAGLDAVR